MSRPSTGRATNSWRFALRRHFVDLCRGSVSGSRVSWARAAQFMEGRSRRVEAECFEASRSPPSLTSSARRHPAHVQGTPPPASSWATCFAYFSAYLGELGDGRGLDPRAMDRRVCDLAGQSISPGCRFFIHGVRRAPQLINRNRKNFIRDIGPSVQVLRAGTRNRARGIEPLIGRNRGRGGNEPAIPAARRNCNTGI